MSTTETISTIDAAALFRAAYENRYTWDSNFPGFSAIAHLTQNGNVHTAHVHVAGDLKITITNASSSEAETAIRQQVQEIIVHRVRRQFEDVHGKNEFTYGETDDSGAVTVLVGGAATGDRYKVHNNIVSLVHRHIHGTVVTINVLSTFNTGEGYLPVDYESFYTKPNANEPDSPKQYHHDEYARFGNYFILTFRHISQADNTNGIETQELRLTDLQVA